MAAADLDDGAMLAKMNAIASLPPSAALHRSANLRYVAGVVNGRSAREGDSTSRNRFEIPFPSATDATALATESVALLCNAVATLRSFARPKRCRQASIRRHVRFSIRKEFAPVGVLDPERSWKQGRPAVNALPRKRSGRARYWIALTPRGPVTAEILRRRDAQLSPPLRRAAGQWATHRT
jgi:hypothetical protein